MYELQGTPPLISFAPARGINIGGGKTFYVRESTGSNDNEGTDPQYPLADLETALGKCTASMNDYIFAEYFSTLSAAPLTINKRMLHIIAVSGGNFDSRNDMNGGSSVSVNIQSLGRDLELAGWNIGNDGTTYGIEVSSGQTMYRCHIHHCTIGNNFSVTDGIYAAEISNSSIDHCMFGEAVSGDAIDMPGSVVMFVCANNLFHGVSGVNFYASLGCQYAFIYNNMFAIADDVNGEAITLPSGGSNNMICNNYAVNGMLNSGYQYNPYRDLASNTSNHWGMNYRGNQVIEPVGA